MYVKVISGTIAFYLKKAVWEQNKTLFVEDAVSSVAARYNVADFVIDTATNQIAKHPLEANKVVLETMFDNALHCEKVVQLSK